MKIRTTVVALLSSLAMVTVFALPASAGAIPIDVTADHITCNSVVGTLKFNPPLTGGGSGGTAIAIKIVLSGCVDPDNANVNILTGTATTPKLSPLAGGSANCSALLGLSSTVGTIDVKWKVAPGATKITPAESDLSVSQTNGTTFGPVGDWNGTYGEFEIGTTYGTATPSLPNSGNNAFAGGDHGHTSTLNTSTGQDITALGLACLTPGESIKQANTGVGSVTIG